jgi:hypothetical protein
MNFRYRFEIKTCIFLVDDDYDIDDDDDDVQISQWKVSSSRITWTELRGQSSRANYTYRATASCRRS